VAVIVAVALRVAEAETPVTLGLITTMLAIAPACEALQVQVPPLKEPDATASLYADPAVAPPEPEL
jgi:NaMN:DMB phosphoribosyltransferase